MAAGKVPLVGLGIYRVSEAAHLSAVPARRIRRWLKGYEFQSHGSRRWSPKVVKGDFAGLAGTEALSFRDLIEIRFVDAFRGYGVSWPALRLAAKRAQELFDTTHPFSTQAFRTDGRTVLVEITKSGELHGETKFLDLCRNQFAIREVLAPYLYKGLEFSADDTVIRWWPMNRTRRIVIDPARSFGQPIVNAGGIPTAVIIRAFRAEDSIPRVAAWFEIEERDVRDAIEFEKRLAA